MTSTPAPPPTSMARPPAPETRRPTTPALFARSVFFWALSILNFFPGCTALVVLNAFIPAHKWDWLLRFFTRNIVRCSGAKFVVHRAPGFDASRPTFFATNHVNALDAFVLYSAMPGVGRGLEIESHFKIPVYGWMMSRFGNVPVPEGRSPSGLRRMMRLARKSYESGISLMTFPEGTRTRTGKMGPFEPGVFRMACEIGATITPVTIKGSYAHHPVGDWRFHPATIVVTLHDTIETVGMKKSDAAQLADRVRAIVALPLGE